MLLPSFCWLINVLPFLRHDFSHFWDALGCLQSANLHHSGSLLCLKQAIGQWDNVSGFEQSSNVHQSGSFLKAIYLAHFSGQNFSDSGFEQSWAWQ